MASLKEIMNIPDEDGHGPDSVQRNEGSMPKSSRPSESTPSTSRYASPTNASFVQSSSQGQRQSLLSHSSHPLVSETTPSSPGTSSGSRRRSNTSSDSMDTSYYGHGHGYVPAGPSRSYAAADSTGGETPVKLTPITGRVSRAKKGVPVHICELCRPPKTFTRAEHLRRHQLSHQPPDLACSIPGCDKVFHRRDLLERHQFRHEQEAKGQGEVGPVSGGTSSGSSGSFVGGPSDPQTFPLPSSTMGAPGHGPRLGLGVANTDVNMGSTSWSSMGDNRNLPGNNHMQPPHGDISGNYRMGSVYAAYIPSGPNNHWQEGSSASGNNSGGTFSAASHPRAAAASGSEWTDAVSSFPMAQRGVPSPVMDSTSGFYTYATSPPQGASSAAYNNTMELSLTDYPEGSSLNSPDHLLNNSTVRSLSPPLALAQSSETLVTMPSAVPSERIASSFTYSRQAVNAPSLLAAQAPTPASLDRELRSAIPAYLNVYWDKVDSVFPFIHKSTFDIQFEFASDQLDLLQCAMAAVATQFLEGKNHRTNGNCLHSYVWNYSKVLTQSEKWSLPLMQTVLLYEYYDRFRGRKKESHRPSSRFAKLYHMVADHANTFAPIPTGSDSMSSWKKWINMETRRRLLSSCFLLDVHSMFYYEQPPIVILNLDYSSPSTLPIPLSTSSTKLWGAPDHQVWGQLVGVSPPLETVNTTLSKPLTAEDVAAGPAFDAAILLGACALYLPRRQSLTEVDPTVRMHMDGPKFCLASLFPQSGIANTYLALHFTPLHVLLSVSGESWVFNKKVLRATMFSEHRQYLDEWCRSGSATVAVTFAARALRAFLGVSRTADGSASSVEQRRGVPWRDISDYWGTYVCVLICWAYGQGGEGDGDTNDASRRTGLQWILEASEMEPLQLGEWPQSRSTLAVVCFARDVLARDCLGGRNILFADSVGVLKKLGGRDGWDWP